MSGARSSASSNRGGGWLIRAIFIATFLVTAFLIVTPLAALLHGSFQTGSPGMKTAFTWKNWTDLGSGNIIHTLLITCFISVVTSVFSTIGGAGLTWLVYRTDFRFKRSLVAAVGLSFFFPGFILAMAWVILASPGGIFNDILDEFLGIEWLQFDIYSVGGIVWIQILHIVPFSFFTLRGPMISMDSSLEEAGYASGASPWAVIRRVTLPLMIFPLLSSLLLCFVLSVEQFAIPAMVGIPGHVNTLATELYLLTSFSPPNTGLAAAIGLAMSAVTGLSIFLQRQIVRRHTAPTVTGRGYRIRPLTLGPWRIVAHGVCLFYVAMSFIIPTLALIYTSGIKFFVSNPFEAAWTWRNYHQIWDSPGTLRALVFCYVARFLPYATETIGAQVVQLDKALEEAAWASGANRLASFRRIILPLLRPALQSGYFLLFIAYFREIAAAALIYTASTQVLSISIWAFFENANWGVASALSIVTTIITVALMGTVMRAPLRV